MQKGHPVNSGMALLYFVFSELPAEESESDRDVHVSETTANGIHIVKNMVISGLDV